MTATEMVPAIGVDVAVRFEELTVDCTVVDVKAVWGKARLLVEPKSGNGRQWVEMGRVTRPTATGQLREA